MLKTITCAVVFLFCTLVQTKLYFNTGFPATHDGENHLARFANYKIAIKEGQIPPRFAPNLVNRYGYPAFNFNYPLANILSLPLSAAKIHPELIFKLIVVLSVFLGCTGMYFWLRALEHSHVSSLVAVTAFGLSPFLSSLLYVRGNIGEILALMILPWLLYALTVRTFRYKNMLLTVSLTSFLLSHNITVLIAAPSLFLYCLLIYKKSTVLWKSVVVPVVTSFSLTAWFWLPAIFEKNETVVSEGVLITQFLQHLIRVDQFIAAPFQFGFSYPGPVDSLSFYLGLPFILALSVSSIFCLQKLFTRQKNVRAYSMVLTALMLLFLQTTGSQFIWQALPFFNIIQFPWRLTILAIPVLTYCTAFIWESAGRLIKPFLLALLLFQALVLFRIQAREYFHKDPVEYDLFSQSTSTKNENRSRTFVLEDIGNWQPTPQILGDGTATVSRWNGSWRSYELELQSESIIIEPTMYFLGWQTTAKDMSGTSREVQYNLDGESKGRISYVLPQGNYTIQTRFTQMTPARILGNSLFFFGLVAISIIVYTERSLHQSYEKK